MAVKWVRNGVKAKTNGHKAVAGSASKAAHSKKGRHKRTARPGETKEERKRRIDLEVLTKKYAKQQEKISGGKGFIPPAMIDAITDAAARNPKGGILLSMEELLHPAAEMPVLIVKTVKGGITNKEEFVQQMSWLGFKVVFLEHGPHLAIAPLIHQFSRT